MKTDDDYFADWESHAFGYGYGTGEQHIIGALRRAFSAMTEDGKLITYDFRDLERATSQEVAWLLIDVLCKNFLIQYGVSPRFGWLTNEGVRLKNYLDSHDVDYLVKQTEKDPDYLHCAPNFCGCDHEPCNNPFWRTRGDREVMCK